jgi:hypothetical protein
MNCFFMIFIVSYIILDYVVNHFVYLLQTFIISHMWISACDKQQQYFAKFAHATQLSHRKWHHTCNYLEQLCEFGSFSHIKKHHTWMVNWRRSCSFCRWNLKHTRNMPLFEPFHFTLWNPNMQLFAHQWQLQNICWQLISHLAFGR